MEIKNLKKAAERIEKAISKKERIILYGDGDLDGICSVIILKEAIQSLGGEISALYFPDREKEGYGLTETALKSLKKFAPALLITMDLGISNFKEMLLAKKLGFTVIIVDHHEVLDKLPKAYLTVDPKQPSDPYPFKGLAACGVTFLLANELLGKRMSPSLRGALVELAALGTIADMMPQTDDNLLIIEEGVSRLFASWRPGIQALFEAVGIDQGNLRDRLGHAISVLNVRDIKDRLPGAYRLFTTSSLESARDIAKELVEKNKVRQDTIYAIVNTIKQRIGISDSPVIFEGDPSFEYVLLGGAASILARELDKPVFLYKKKRGESIGSVRAPAGYNTVEAMKGFAKSLVAYGGHAPASGFRLKTKNLAKFKKYLATYFKMQIRK
ncbi:MAG: single-stranded-DNA-specific exonuclease [Parcubacteria group bacterium Greene0714_21]|nr:MAG: single-stranded-DNA-specific exonuclease [Parcubacteria group bacterium Greene0416_39]TSC97836.1 MAG: single-stranded-DNA-specific exonuclease [Parcubacteria group bacterium Greene1014_47]TSD04571.1 MAG: single-stranded-DNA-specific exonuclease [Parcubacteria group bacterium Greene0714_21]